MTTPEKHVRSFVFPFDIISGCFCSDTARQELRDARYDSCMVDDFFDLVERNCSKLFINVAKVKRLLKGILIAFPCFFVVGFAMLIVDPVLATARMSKEQPPLSIFFFLGSGIVLFASSVMCTTASFTHLFVRSALLRAITRSIDALIKRENETRFVELGMVWSRSFGGMDWIRLTLDESASGVNTLRAMFEDKERLEAEKKLERAQLHSIRPQPKSNILSLQSNDESQIRSDQGQLDNPSYLDDSLVPLSRQETITKPAPKKVRFFDIKRDEAARK